jgi:hypothetical protein
MVNPLLLYICPGFPQALLRLWKAAEGPDARLGTLRPRSSYGLGADGRGARRSFGLQAG